MELDRFYRDTLHDLFRPEYLDDTLAPPMGAPAYAFDWSWPGSYRMRNSLAQRKIRTDVRETPTQYQVRAELPGIDKENIKVHVDGQLLTVQAEHKPADLPEGHAYLVHERKTGVFKRVLRMPEDCNMDAPRSCIDRGVLCLSFERRPERAKKTITL